jgi:chemotaxis protein MotB
MAAGKRRAKHEGEPEAENTERWLLTYADMMTLLVAFFIMMYSMSVMDMKKFNKVAISIRSGFGGQFGGHGNNPYAKRGAGADIKSAQLSSSPSESPGPFGTDDVGSDDVETMQSIGNYIKRQLALMKLDSSIVPMLDTSDNQGNRYRVIITDALTFTPESTALSDQCKTNLTQAGLAIRDKNLKILVEGYAKRPSGTNSAYADSWQIAAERARVVGAYMSDTLKINPRRLSLISYGEWRDPGKTKKLTYSQSGVWESRDSKPHPAATTDRVVVSVIID